MRVNRLVVAAVVLILYASKEVQAAPITFAFTGTVGAVNAALTPPFNVGDPLNGTFTFDPTGPDIDSTLNVYGIAATAAATIGTYAFTSTGRVQFLDVTAALTDAINLSTIATGNVVNGHVPTFFGLTIASSIDLDLNNLPVFPLLVNNLPQPFRLTFDSVFDVTGTVNTLAPVAAVPEPASLLLLGTGLAGVAARRYRRQRS